MSKYINPFADMSFKRIFGQEMSKDLLIDFLNNLLKGEVHIVTVHFLDKEQITENEDDRSLIYDVYCETDTEQKIIIEMQNKYQPYFKSRSIYYLARAISKQGESGKDWQYKVDAVYCISLLNFSPANMEKKFRTDIALMDMNTGKLFSNQMRLVYLQLPCFDKQVDDCENDFERWIYILKHMEELKRMPFTLKSKVFKKLEEVCDVASLTKEERIEYDRAIRQYRDTLGVLDGAKNEGREEGREKGREEGREERSAEVAKSMKRKGYPLEEIMELTGLTPEQIAALE
jgi:predicted transposase/invertase (TIGR01784 family)